MKLDFIKRGSEALAEERERMERLRESKKGKLFRFFPPGDEEEVTIRFLTDEPVLFREHVYDEGKTHVTCTGKDCENCKDGNNPQSVAGWLIWDTREYEAKVRDKQGNDTGKTKTVEGSVKPLVRGMTDAAAIQKMNEKYGLKTREYSVCKTGKGKQSKWTFDRSDKESPLTSRMLEKYMATLPEQLRNLTPEEVLERQIVPPEYLEDAKPKSKKFNPHVEEDDDEDEPKKRKLKLKHKK
jgi:hypothetical protein